MVSSSIANILIILCGYSGCWESLLGEHINSLFVACINLHIYFPSEFSLYHMYIANHLMNVFWGK